ncbi:MAG: V-type ATP synthase subunit A, partial [Spirochaetes bacterium]|nr:V-type ATP synthase subunit A [Spirochaetota bacterium]
MEEVGKIVKVAGPLVIASNIRSAKIYDVVRVSEQRLMGEVIEMRGDEASIQVYEETGGLGVGEPVYPTGVPLSVELGPGLIESIYDGVQRPLDIIREQAGDLITRGIDIPGLNREKKWKFDPGVKSGDVVAEGDILGTVDETILVKHRIMVSPGVSGRVKKIDAGEFNITETVAVISTEKGDVDVTMMQKWPVRIARPYKRKLDPDEPLSTGQRVIDAFFPISKGGTACIPGPFGSGKTVVQHQLAKYADAQIIVYVGCGERGNEMTDVLMEFPEL